jgi:hypothetical protein
MDTLMKLVILFKSKAKITPFHPAKVKKKEHHRDVPFFLLF